jgi:hypothetical protein
MTKTRDQGHNHFVATPFQSSSRLSFEGAQGRFTRLVDAPQRVVGASQQPFGREDAKDGKGFSVWRGQNGIGNQLIPMTADGNFLRTGHLSLARTRPRLAPQPPELSFFGIFSPCGFLSPASALSRPSEPPFQYPLRCALRTFVFPLDPSVNLRLPAAYPHRYRTWTLTSRCTNQTKSLLPLS